MAIADKPETHVNGSQTEKIAVTEKTTGEVIGHIPVTERDAVAQAVERARNAQKGWGAMPIQERIRYIRKFLDLLWQEQGAMVQTIRRETGKPDGGAFVEIVGVDTIIQWYLHHAPRLLKPKRRQSTLPLIHQAKLYYRPHGVVGIISPWNYPFLLPAIDSLPALIAGNAVVYKPSEITPFSMDLAVDLLRRAGIPRDVVQLVHGDGRTGAALVDHVDYVGFTGSTATGIQVAKRAAERLIPYSLELGGKDPMIILDDADLDMAATGALRGAFENAGQLCMSVERAYVEAPIYDAFMQRVDHWIKAFNTGTDPKAHMGSFTHERELQRTEAHIDDAVKKGAKVLYGGQRRPDLGPLFFEPTVLVDVDHSMDIMRDETFGPVLPIMKVQNENEAVALANDTNYGLAATVYTSDTQRGERVLRQIDSGDGSVNGAQLVVATPALPSGGQRNSGVGRRNGAEGILRYVATHSILVNTGVGQSPDLYLLTDDVRTLLEALRGVRRYVPWI